MTQEAMSPLRRRMVEDMQIRGLEATTQTSYIRAIEAFAGFLGRSRECQIFRVCLIRSMLPERSKDDDHNQRVAGRTAEGLRAA